MGLLGRRGFHRFDFDIASAGFEQHLALALIGGFIAGRDSAGEAIPKAARYIVMAHGS